MPAATKKRPPMEAEPGEGKAHEMRESPEEEVREGSESEESHYGKTNRKRTAKGAKKTKAPMDAEGCGCGSKKGTKCSCDGGCGYSKKMDSALTPQEYLAACDLGIQDRSRQYIRARLDSAERLDLKCGKGAISPGKKCTKGPAQKAKAVASSVAALGGLAINAGAGGYAVGATLTGNYAKAGRAFQIAGAGQALSGVGLRGLGLKKESNRLLRNGAITAGIGTAQRELETGEIRSAISNARKSRLGKRLRYFPANAVGRARMAAINRRSLPKAKMKNGKVSDPWQDSVYADGYTLDLNDLAI